MSGKTVTTSSLEAPVTIRRMSGRMAFRRSYGYTGIEGAERWKQLPAESKKYWTAKGKGLQLGERKLNSIRVKRLPIK